MSSANLKCSNDRPQSRKSKPKCSISSRQFAIDISNTEQNSRGLKTHPCRTPPCKSKNLLQPLLPTTCPCWFRYKFWIIQIMCSERPCSERARHSAGQCTRSPWWRQKTIIAGQNEQSPFNVVTSKRCCGQNPGGRQWRCYTWNLFAMLKLTYNWNAAWNKVLHLWNERIKNFMSNAHANTWSYITCKSYWNLARHVAALPAHHFGTRRLGRPQTWESKFHAHYKYANLRSWREAVLDDVVWNSHLGLFVNLCRM